MKRVYNPYNKRPRLDEADMLLHYEKEKQLKAPTPSSPTKNDVAAAVDANIESLPPSKQTSIEPPESPSKKRDRETELNEKVVELRVHNHYLEDQLDEMQQRLSDSNKDKDRLVQQNNSLSKKLDQAEYFAELYSDRSIHFEEKSIAIQQDATSKLTSTRKQLHDQAKHIKHCEAEIHHLYNVIDDLKYELRDAQRNRCSTCCSVM